MFTGKVGMHYSITTMTSLQTSLPFRILRQIIYLVILILIVFGFWKISDVYKSATVQEYGIFESIQSVVLFLIAASFLVQSSWNKTFRPILFSLSMLAMAALVREQDAYFDELIPYIGWTWAWMFPMVGLIVLLRNRATLHQTMYDFLHSHSFYMMVTAMTIILPVAQCLGHRSFLSDLLGNDEVDAFLVRRIMEEPIELLGYINLLLSSIECAIELRRK